MQLRLPQGQLGLQVRQENTDQLSLLQRPQELPLPAQLQLLGSHKEQ